jgi:thiol-disulfide isomerase/thioredoxin
MRLRAFVTLLLLAACGEAGAPPQPQPDQPGWSGPREAAPTGKLDRSRAGTSAPDSEFEDPDGQTTSLAEFRGKPLLVNLWATWCAPCVAEMPTLDALAAREGERLQVLAVSQDLDGRAKVEEYFARQRFSKLEPYLDAELALMSQLQVGTLPTTILYDAEGREVWRITGMEDWESRHTAELLSEVSRAEAR